MPIKRKMTRENLENAYAGESQAYMRYLIFSQVAEQEGKPNIARLFKAIAYAEEVHATNHYRALGYINNTVKNLDMAIAGEIYEVEEMYPAYNAVAKLQGEKEAEITTHGALEAEKIHVQMYKKAKEAAEDGKDVALGTIQICSVCDYTAEGEAPEKCPICGASREKFKAF